MSKKLIAIICIAIVLTIGFVLVAVGVIGPKNQPATKGQNITIPNLDSVPKTASLFFATPLIQASAQPTQVDVLVETGGQEISGTQLELSYDPQVLKNVTIASPKDSFFGTPNDYKILFTNIDEKNGLISFTIAANNRSLAKKGNGKVATLSFTVTPNTQETSTSVTFAPTTLVTIFGANQTVLKEAAGLTIMLNKTLSQAQ